MRPGQSHQDHQQPSQRGGMPLEARLPLQLGHGSSPTLDRTIATSQKVVLFMITGSSLYLAFVLVRKWLEQNGRSRARNEALRELLGTPDEESEESPSMPGSATGFGGFPMANEADSKDKIGGKKGKRVVSKSNDILLPRLRSLSSAMKSTSTSHQPKMLSTQPFTSKLKAMIPGLSASSSRASHAIPAIEEPTLTEESTTSNATNPIDQGSSEAEAVGTETNVQQTAFSAAERKKLKKKQNRANRAQDRLLLAAWSAESDARDSPSPAGSTISLPSTSEQWAFSEENASRDVQTLVPAPERRTEKANAIQYRNTSEPESITPTATANTTPKASMRSRMAGPPPVSMLRNESPTRRRSSASTDDNADVYRDSIGSAPSLVSTFSPKSGRSRAESASSLPPVTPLAMNVGLNVLDADPGMMKEDENTMGWQKVGKKEKAERKQKGKGRVEAESRMGPVSPPVSTASGTSSEFNLLLNVESRPTQSLTDASSASWMSEPPPAPCPDCAQRRREEDENTLSPTTADAGSSSGNWNAGRLSELHEKLENTVGEQKRQKAIIDSLTGTNISLSEQLAEFRDQRDKSTSEAQAARKQLEGLRRELGETKAASEQLDGLQRELGEAQETIAHLQSQLQHRRDREKRNEDFRRKYDNMVQKHESYMHHQNRLSDETSRNTARLEAQLAEMSRIMERLQFQAYPSIMPTTANSQYALLPAPMMMPSPHTQAMSPGLGGQSPYPHNAYMLASPPSAPFPGHDGGPRRVSPHQQPRPRYEGNYTSASGLASNEMYNNQPTGMWALGSPETARPPHSPSRHADISTSILKPRRASADLGTTAAIGAEASSESHTGIEGSSTAPQAPHAAIDEQSQGGNQVANDDAVQGQKIDLQSASLAPENGQPASNGQTNAPPPAATGSTPPPAEDQSEMPNKHLEFTFPRKLPSESDGDAGDQSRTHATQTCAPANPNQATAEQETSEATPAPEEEYDEPVYASIRPQG
ncbi:hypothetical protein QFC21_006613 [Naganishia friedmannii]|uniref:Uncharacterized protein n=1 Tax=Naganishia friedmannii TaxID=89922 RepID=A0ACC2V1L2_9TREE|nr:hypothetical protein QFC21_006613 [Naganishia friedmannii]